MTHLQITLRIASENRAAAGAVFQQFKAPFLTTVAGARSKQLLARDEDVQVLHGFETEQQAHDYLQSDLFNKDVVVGLQPLLLGNPEVRIYSVLG
jgi:hypothetical protein